MTRIMLVRHAMPAEDSRGRCYGSLDVSLSPPGVDQATALAERLRPIAFDAIYTSPRTRARATADLLSAGRSIEPVPDERLRELDFGSFEGRAYEEIEREAPDLYRQWMKAPTSVRFPDGESFGDLRARATDAVAALRTRHVGGTVAVVTHGGVVRAAVAYVLGLADERIFRLDVGYCRVSVVDWFDEAPVLRLLNGDGGDVPTAALG